MHLPPKGQHLRPKEAQTLYCNASSPFELAIYAALHIFPFGKHAYLASLASAKPAAAAASQSVGF
jgi:hypothetical protein